MSLTTIFADPKSKPAKELARLDARRRTLLAQERDALSALEASQAEHDRLERVIRDGEAKALAFDKDDPSTKARPKLAKLAKDIDTWTSEADTLANAIVAIDEEARRVVMVHCDELVSEAIASHDAARQRIRELCAGLDTQAAALKAAYVQVQSVMAAAGRNAETARMRVPPSVETLAREGGAPALLHPDDRALVA
jgi:chromosome segregation ATPase